MTVIVDTSVWSLALNRKSPSLSAEVKCLKELILQGRTIFLPNVIYQEILQGARTPEQMDRLRSELDSFPELEVSRVTHMHAAQLFVQCRSKGLQASSIDCLIAACAIDNKCTLLTTDKDFRDMERISELQLFSMK